MGTVHFLNVGQGDCSIIEHLSGRISVIDICNGNMPEPIEEERFKHTGKAVIESLQGNYRQKKYPVNPIRYLQKIGINKIFRFILTHPDMDHMSGMEKLFDTFTVCNFWDTENTKTMTLFKSSNDRADWSRYQTERQRALHLYHGSHGQYYDRNIDESEGGDYLQVLCPTPELMEQANQRGEYNDASYVILYQENGRKILFSGDAEEAEWDVLLKKHKQDLTNVDVLIAPHHGRKSGGNDEFLDILKPKLTLFGNAKSGHLNYNAWNNRGLKFYTNNEGGTFVLHHNGNYIEVYCSYEGFAKERNSKISETQYGWFIKCI